MDVDLNPKDLENTPKKKRRKVSFTGLGPQEEQRVLILPDADSVGAENMPEPALPQFPTLRTPVSPSSKSLYRQSLDQAMAEGEIVEAGISVPLDSKLDNESVDRFGMDNKSRRRLAELGFSNLFAGKLL